MTGTEQEASGRATESFSSDFPVLAEDPFFRHHEPLGISLLCFFRYGLGCLVHSWAVVAPGGKG